MVVLSTLKQRSIAGVCVLLFLIYLRRQKRTRTQKALQPRANTNAAKRIVVNRIFFIRLWGLMKRCVFKNKVPHYFVLFNFLLVFRTILSIYISGIKGKIVKAMISSNKRSFFKQMGNLALMAIPGSVTNSLLDYLQNIIALNMRKGLVSNMNSCYVKGKTAYQLLNIDSRIENPDQILTEDIQKWTLALSDFYSDFSKPTLDIILFSRKLANMMTYKGPALMISWYLLSGYLIKLISPAFGKLIAEGLKREGTFRAGHQRLIQHSEEIAFLRGDVFELNTLSRKLKSLLDLYRYTNKLRLYMGVVDSMLVKYGAYNVGMAVLALPIFGPDKAAYLQRVGNDPAAIMRDYEQNSSLLVNLAKAIGKIVISYKKLQELAGTTHRINELLDVVKDLQENGRYQRNVVANKELIYDPELKGNSLRKGKNWHVKDSIKFEEVPIIAPNGDELTERLSIKIKKGMNCIIEGPNGSGKTALLRVLAGLWPLFEGQIFKVVSDDIMYLPQRVYLPRGSLRDQIIYPHTQSTKTDYQLQELLDKVKLGYLLERVGGFNYVDDWYDVLSGGERQRISVARLFYHLPKFAVLDEATSAVSVEIENTLYLTAKKEGMTLITVTNRKSLYEFHDYALILNGDKSWVFESVKHDE